MKRFNLSQLMKAAHRTYKYVNKKKGITWAETLKAAWQLEKISVAFAESEEKRSEAARAKAREPRPVVTRADYMGHISDIALYGSSYVNGGHFVND